MKKAGKILIAVGTVLCALLAMSALAYIFGMLIHSLNSSFIYNTNPGMFIGYGDELVYGYLNLSGENALINVYFLLVYLGCALGFLGIPTLIIGYALDVFGSKDRFYKFLIASGATLCGFLLFSVLVFAVGQVILIDSVNQPFIFDPMGCFRKVKHCPVYYTVELIKYASMFIGSLGIPVLSLGVIIKMLSGTFNNKESKNLTEV